MTSRGRGDRQAAQRAYDRALALDPDHIGAHEYLGEMEAEAGHMDAAQGHLQALERLCPQGCEELTELRAAISQREQG